MLHTQTTYSRNILNSLKTLKTTEKCRGSSKGFLSISKIHKDKDNLLRLQAHSHNYMSILHAKQSVNKKQVKSNPY